MLNILAWIIIGLVSLEILGKPFLFGQERKPYGPADWLSSVFFGTIMILLALRVLEII